MMPKIIRKIQYGRPQYVKSFRGGLLYTNNKDNAMLLSEFDVSATQVVSALRRMTGKTHKIEFHEQGPNDD